MSKLEKLVRYFNKNIFLNKQRNSIEEKPAVESKTNQLSVDSSDSCVDNESLKPKPIDNRLSNETLIAEKVTEIKIDKSTPLVSIVVPIYNVEKYLEQCLTSIKNQTYSNLEVILVNDGSPDNSIQIANDFCENDSRFIVYTQENGGLSAARNTGIRLATGQYIWFIDSDDIIPTNAVNLMMTSLQKTGSDFVVGHYCRFNLFGYKKAGSWIQSAHEKARYNITLESFPEILVNATAWSKLVNYEFLIKNDLYFPVGVLYEDQLWSTKLYSSAKSFDVLDNVIYDWRVRDDNSSISQQSKDVENLGAILTAIETSVNELNNRGLNAVAQERVVQFMSNNMREYIACLEHTDEAYMERLADAVVVLSKDLPLSKWQDIPAHLAAVEWLLLHKDYDRVKEALELGIQNTNTMTATCDDNDLLLRVPYWDCPIVNFPREVLSLKENQYKPNIELRRAYWLNNNELYLEGWAFLPLVNPEEVSLAKVTLISDEIIPHSIELEVENYLHPQLDRISSHQLNDYRASGFKIVLDFNELKVRNKINYRLQFTLVAGSISRTEYLSKIATWGAAGQVKPSTSNNGTGVRFIQPKNQPVLLGIEKKRFFAEDVSVVDGKFFFNIKTMSELTAIQIVSLDNKHNQLNKSLFHEITRISDGYYQCVIHENDLPIDDAEHWLIRAIDVNCSASVISWPYFLDTGLNILGHRFELFNTAYGNIGIRKSSAAFHVMGIQQNEQGIKILGGLRSCGDTSLSARLVANNKSIICEIDRDSDNNFIISIPFFDRMWGEPILLPSNRYELELKIDGSDLNLLFSSEVVSTFPLWLNEEAPIVARIERNPSRKRLVMIVQPSIPLEQQGARNKQQYILAHQNDTLGVDTKAVFFRTYYGESATCNALAIHQELYNRKANFKLYWSVKDSSVRLPEGATPVVEQSKEWYELYSSAKYIIDNTHQPDFFEKKPEQVVIATFHGYPFKKAGIPYWESEGFSKARVASFLRRHDQWDYLLSPAPYASPILEEVFPSTTAQTLEVGYPRNDVFFSSIKSDIRKKTRLALGIKDSQKVILYAPTYRDNLAQDEFRAKMIDYLDIEKLINILGDNYVVLVRGHMINARMNEALNVNTAGQVIDVTNYPEISDLCVASDIGILDYSSLRFDYTLTNNPMIFFVPDLESYLSDIRGSLVPYEETAPGPFVSDTDSVIYWVQNLEILTQKYSEQRNTFLNKYMPLEDGMASKRFVDQVFKFHS